MKLLRARRYGFLLACSLLCAVGFGLFNAAPAQAKLDPSDLRRVNAYTFASGNEFLYYDGKDGRDAKFYHTDEDGCESSVDYRTGTFTGGTQPGGGPTKAGYYYSHSQLKDDACSEPEEKFFGVTDAIEIGEQRFFYKQIGQDILHSASATEIATFKPAGYSNPQPTADRNERDAGVVYIEEDSKDGCKDLIVRMVGKDKLVKNGDDRWVYIAMQNPGPIRTGELQQRIDEYSAFLGSIGESSAIECTSNNNSDAFSDFLGVNASAKELSGRVGFGFGKGSLDARLISQPVETAVGVALAAGDAVKDKRDRATTPPGGAGDDDVACAAGAFSWILCPLIELMADATKTTASLIEGQLQYKLLTTNPGGVKAVWQNVLNVANILLVITFMFIIFSQSTSIGLTNYGIKRMLPRLIAAAILMNLSFYVCAFAIDISNILGNSITGLLFSTGGVAESVAERTNAVSAIAGAGVTVVAIAGIIILAVIFFVPVLLAVLAVFITLVARQVILTLLIVAAPLAFAAWLLPNTEKYFKKWYQLFFQMLILYPLVMAMFGASVFVADFIGSGAQADSGFADPGGIVTHLVALVVLVLPLIALPFMFKLAGGALGRINDMSRRGVGKMGGDAAGRAAQKAGKNALRRAPGIRSGFEVANSFKEGREERYKRGVLGRQNRRLTADGKRGEAARIVAGGFGQEGRARALAAGIAGQRKEGSEAAQNAEFLLQESRAAAEFATGIYTGTGLTGSDKIAYDTFMKAGGVKTEAGARAASSVLGKTGGLTYEGIEKLSAAAISSASSDSERVAIGSAFSQHVNDVARDAGFSHLAESTTNDDGSIFQGGQRGSFQASIEKELDGKGAGSVVRQIWEDKSDIGGGVQARTHAARHAATKMNSADVNTAKAFRVSLADTDDRRIESMATAMGAAGLIAGVATFDTAGAITFMKQQRDTGRREKNQPI